VNSEEEGVPSPSFTDSVSSITVFAGREDGGKDGEAFGVASGRKGVGGSVRGVGNCDLVGWGRGLMEGKDDECNALKEYEEQDNCRLQ